MWECERAIEIDRQEAVSKRKHLSVRVCTIVVIKMRVLLLRFCVRMCSFHDTHVHVCVHIYSLHRRVLGAKTCNVHRAAAAAAFERSEKWTRSDSSIRQSRMRERERESGLLRENVERNTQHKYGETFFEFRQVQAFQILLLSKCSSSSSSRSPSSSSSSWELQL